MPLFFTAEEADQLDARQYIRVLRTSLARNAHRTAEDGALGRVSLRMKLDAEGDVLLCEAKADTPDTYPSLVGTVRDACWNSIWSPVPTALKNPADGGLEVIAPLIFTGASSETDHYEDQLEQCVRIQQFVWDKTFAKNPPNAFGRAHFTLTANAKGEVLSCTVELTSHSFRPDRFTPDPTLQQSLIEQCMGMNVKQMPGFEVGAGNTATRVVSVDYMPWKKHVGKR